MERKKLSKLVALALLSSSVAVTGSAYSAGYGSSGSEKAKDERTTQSRSKSDRPQRQAQQQQGDRFWASDIIGKNVDMAGDRDAEIKDLIVDTRTGQVRHAVTEIDTEGKNRLYAVPLHMFRLGADNKLTLNVDKSWLAQRKSWSEDKWPEMSDAEYWRDDRPAPAAGAPDKSAEGRPSTAGAEGGVHRLSKLIGHDVHNKQDKKLGEIEDAVVNLKSQKVDFVLFAHDPGILKGENEYAVPLASFQFPAATGDGGEGKQRVVLNTTEDKIKGMKQFKDDDRKRINDPEFMSGFNLN